MENNTSQQNIIIYSTEDNKVSIELHARDGQVWLNQKQLAELFDTSKSTISEHAANILKESELKENSVVRNFRTTAIDGKQYSVIFYSLEMILAIGFRIKSKRGTQFRIWANQHLKLYLIKGFVMDDERLKNPDGRPDYFDELLERIRDIRASEKRFYQKVRDLLALSSDYDPHHKKTQMFFAETQNKLLYAVTKKTAAELVIDRANLDKPNMGLTAWKGAKVRKGDVTTAKNYLTADEIDTLNRLTVLFLETAELRVKERKDLHLRYWQSQVDKLLEFNDRDILAHQGNISHRTMEKQVKMLYDQFNVSRKVYEAQQADKDDLKQLEELENTVKQASQTKKS